MQSRDAAFPTDALLLLLRLWQGPHLRIGQKQLDARQSVELVGRDGNHLCAKPKDSADVDLDGLDFVVGPFLDLHDLPESFLLSEL